MPFNCKNNGNNIIKEAEQKKNIIVTLVELGELKMLF